MSENACPLCEPDHELVFYRGALVLGVWDRYPVNGSRTVRVLRGAGIREPGGKEADYRDMEAPTSGSRCVVSAIQRGLRGIIEK